MFDPRNLDRPSLEANWAALSTASALDVSTVRVTQLPHGWEERPILEASRRLHGTSFPSLGIKVSAAQIDKTLHIALGHEGHQHKDIIDRNLLLAAGAEDTLAWQGGGYVRVDWSTGETKIVADSDTLGPLPVPSLRDIQEVVSQLVDAYRRAALPAIGDGMGPGEIALEPLIKEG